MSPKNMENQPHVGIPFALDDNENKVYACDAKEHIPYRCPFCRCLMFRKRSPKNNYFFSRFPGEIHVAKQCKQIEKSGKYHTFMSSEDPQALAIRLCRVSSQRQKSEKNISSNEKSKPAESTINDELLATRFANLGQIFAMGLVDKNPHEHIGDYELCEYYVHYNWAQAVIGYRHADLHGRILQAAIIRYDTQQEFFLLGMYSNAYSVRFALEASTSAVYNSLHQKLYKKQLIPESNKLRPVKKANQILVISTNWRYIPMHQCQGYYCRAEKKYCSNCGGLYLGTAVTPKQVFLIPQ